MVSWFFAFILKHSINNHLFSINTITDLQSIHGDEKGPGTLYSNMKLLLILIGKLVPCLTQHLSTVALNSSILTKWST